MPSYEDSKKAVLKQMIYIRKEIKTKEELIVKLASKGEGTTPNYEKSNVQGGEDICKVQRYADLILDIRKLIDSERKKLTVCEFEIEMAIMKITDPCSRILLERRYLLGEEWREVAYFLGFTEDHTKGYLHGKAIKEIQNLTRDNTN